VILLVFWCQEVSFTLPLGYESHKYTAVSHQTAFFGHATVKGTSQSVPNKTNTFFKENNTIEMERFDISSSIGD